MIMPYHSTPYAIYGKGSPVPYFEACCALARERNYKQRCGAGVAAPNKGLQRTAFPARCASRSAAEPRR